MTYSEMKEAVSKIDFKRLSHSDNQKKGAYVARLINSGDMTEEQYNKGINEKRLSELLSFIESAYKLGDRMLKSFDTEDECWEYSRSHNCGTRFKKDERWFCYEYK